MATRFEIVLEQDSFFFQLRTAEGEVILRSLGGDSKIMTQNELLHLRNSLRDPERLVPKAAEDDGQFVVVKDKDGSVLARTARVGSRAELDELVQRVVAAAGAPMVDLSKRRTQVG